MTFPRQATLRIVNANRFENKARRYFGLEALPPRDASRDGMSGPARPSSTTFTKPSRRSFFDKPGVFDLSGALLCHAYRSVADNARTVVVGAAIGTLIAVAIFVAV